MAFPVLLWFQHPEIHTLGKKSGKAQVKSLTEGAVPLHHQATRMIP